MNENEIYEVEMDEVIPAEEEEVSPKKTKKPLRKRIGEKLVSDEPLIPKKVKRGVAIALGVLATGAAVAVGFFAGHGGDGVEALPEGATELLTEGDPPFDMSEVTDAVVETTTE